MIQNLTNLLSTISIMYIPIMYIVSSIYGITQETNVGITCWLHMLAFTVAKKFDSKLALNF